MWDLVPSSFGSLPPCHSLHSCGHPDFDGKDFDFHFWRNGPSLPSLHTLDSQGICDGVESGETTLAFGHG